MESYLSIEQVINKIKDQTNKTFDYSNVADLVVQDIFTPVFPYIGYLCSVSEGIAYDLNKRSCYLQPVKNNRLIELIQGKRSKHSASMVDEYICNIDDDFLLAKSFSDQKIRYALYEYCVLECSPLSLPCDFQGFMSYHPTEPYTFTRDSLRISNKEVDSYLLSSLEKEMENSTFLNLSDKDKKKLEKAEELEKEKLLKIIGALVFAITDKETPRPHKINQSWIAQTIDDMTRGKYTGMSKSTLEKRFSEANKAFKPYAPHELTMFTDKEIQEDVEQPKSKT